MKKGILVLGLILVFLTGNAQTGIGTTTPDASAKLDVSATNKGFLPPRVTLTSTTDAATIPSPAEGLLVYNKGSVGLQAGYYYWNGASWSTIATSSIAGSGVMATDMVKLYGEAHSSAAGKISSATGYVFTVPVSGRYLFDFTSGATTLNGGTNTINFQVRQGTTVLGSDTQSSYNNNVHVEYNGKVEVNLQSGVSYNVYNYATSGSFETNDYDRVYMKQVAGNLPVSVYPWTLSGTNTYNTTGNVGIGTTTPTARLNIAGGGIRIATGFGNATSRPALNSGSVGSYEIRGVGAGSGTAQSDGTDDGFLRLSAGGGTNTNTQASIDLSGYSTVADMSSTIAMRTLGTERLRIDPYGKVGLGTSSPATSLHIENGNTFGNPGSTSSPSIYVYNNNTASSTANATVSVRTAGTGSGKPYYSLDVNGAFGYSMGVNNPTDQLILNASWNFNTSSASNNAIIINRSGQNRVVIPNSLGGYMADWPSSWGGGLATYDITCGGIYYSSLFARSDRRLKNTITDLDDSILRNYLQLRPVTYYWNQDKPRDTKLQYGLIAQEVELLFPEMVNTATDTMQTKSINYQALHALSLKVIQEQQKQIEDLQQKQAALEQRLLMLESKKE